MCIILHDWLCTHGCFQVSICLCVYVCVVLWPVCVWDIRMHACMYLSLLYELVFSVCECGRGRPSACQYVLMLHIWFPNFPPLLPTRLSAPLHHDVRTLFCFFRVAVGRWWRGCLMSDGPAYRTSTFFLSSSVSASSSSFLHFAAFFSLIIRDYRLGQKLHLLRWWRRASLFPSPLFASHQAAGNQLLLSKNDDGPPFPIVSFKFSPLVYLDWSINLSLLLHRPKIRKPKPTPGKWDSECFLCCWLIWTLH